MKIAFFSVLVWACAAIADADVMPIYPVYATVKADAGRLRLHLDVDAAYWSNEVLPAGPRNQPWPEPQRAAAEKYINESLPLRLDGRLVLGRLARARFYHEPWAAVRRLGQEGAEGRYAFDLEYPLAGKNLRVSGKSAFYLEEWNKFLADPERAKAVSWKQDFRTKLFLAGPRGRTIEIAMTSPDFSFDFSEIARSRWQAAGEALSIPWFDWDFLFWELLLILAAALAWPPAAAARRAFLGAAFAVLGCTAGGLRLPGYGQWLSLAALAAASWFGSGPFWLAAAWAAGAATGAGIGQAPDLPGIFEGRLVGPMLAAASCVALTAAAAALLCPFLLEIHLAWVRRHSEDQAPALARGQRRLAAAVLSGIALLQMAGKA